VVENNSTSRKGREALYRQDIQATTWQPLVTDQIGGMVEKGVGVILGMIVAR
jgi:hypothetical protein